MSFNNNLKLVLASTETVYGDQTLALTGADAVWITGFQPAPSRESTDRDVASPHAQGAPPVPGLSNDTFQAGIELGAYTVVSGATLPAEDLFLLGASFHDGVFDAGPPLTITYSLSSCGEDSVSIWWYDIECSALSNANLHKFFGARLDGTISAVAGQPLMFNINGQGNAYIPSGGASIAGVVLPPFKPTPALNGEAIVTVHDPVGGDINLPSRVYSLEVQLLNALTAQPGVRGGEGIESVENRRSTAPTATLVMDTEPFATLNVREAINKVWPITVEMHFPTRAAGVNSVGIKYTGYIADQRSGEQDGTKSWSLALKGGWPGATIGEQPADGWVQVIYTTTP